MTSKIGDMCLKSAIFIACLAPFSMIGAAIYFAPAAMRKAEEKAAILASGGTVEFQDWRITAVMAISAALSAIVFYRSIKVRKA